MRAGRAGEQRGGKTHIAIAEVETTDGKGVGLHAVLIACWNRVVGTVHQDEFHPVGGLDELDLDGALMEP
jgi:hypothetical protein